MMAILSIQSWVAYGHVGNAAAVLPLQLLGFEVWAVHTVQFSNHTGYRQWRGTVFPAEEVAAVIQGITERGVLGKIDAVLTGYLGSVGLGETALGAVAMVKAANPGAIWACDPVMGDHGRGVFVHPDLPGFFRDRVLPQADILTPNHFELENLTGTDVRTLDDALAAVASLRAIGPRVVLVTSLRRREARPETVEMLAVDETGAWLAAVPRLDIEAHGAGDAVAALFLGHYLKRRDTGSALAAATSAIHAILSCTLEAGSGELALVAAQGDITAPTIKFDAVRVE